MVSLLSEVTYLGIVSTTTSKFLPVDREKVEGQPAAHGRSALIEFSVAGRAGTFHGIVGVNEVDHRMLGGSNFVAYPCPPFCPVKAEARAVSYP